MGFGHRVYKNFDPRAKIIKQIAEQVFDVTGKNPLIDIAVELERIALARGVLRDAEALPQRRLLLRHHLRGDEIPDGHLPVLFAIGRTPGWLAQWQEMLLDKEAEDRPPAQVHIVHPSEITCPSKKR